MRSVCVFCGGNSGARPLFAEAAARVGEVIADAGLWMVFGGSSVGLMGITANAALARGGRVLGVIPEGLATKEIAHHGLTELHVVASMHERKAMMAARADAFVALPGGFGTLDELFEILTWGQLGLHKKPIALLNVDGYYNSLIDFLDRAVEEQLLHEQHRGMLLIESNPERLVLTLETYQPPDVEKWIKASET